MSRFKYVVIFIACVCRSVAVAAEDIETIYVVAPKSMLLTNRFELALLGAHKINDRVTEQTGGQLSLIYHIRESMAVELLGSYFFRRMNSAASGQLRAATEYTWELVQFYRVPWLAMANFQWTPFSGKLSFHDISLGTFSLYLTVGAGAAGLEITDPTSVRLQLLSFSQPVNLIVGYGLGLRFYFLNHLGVRLEVKDDLLALAARKEDFRGISINEDVSTFDISHLVLVQLGISYVF